MPASSNSSACLGLTLVLNAAEGRLQFVIGQNNLAGNNPAAELLCAQDWQAQGQGAELLAAALSDMLNRLGISASNIRQIAAVTGPGSFTGLRLATVTAASLARGNRALQAGIDLHCLLAYQAFTLLQCFESGGSIAVITHARRGLVYMRFFSVHSPQDLFTQPGPVLVLSVAEAITRLREAAKDAKIFILGSGVNNNLSEFETIINNDNSSISCLPDAYNIPSPLAMLDYALQADYTAVDLSPQYVRPSDAEENLAQISERLGQSQDEAQQRLTEILSGAPTKDSIIS